MNENAATAVMEDNTAPPMADPERLAELTIKAAEPPKSGKASICRPSDRAPSGWKRYRLRAATPDGTKPVEYILARNAADAEAEYAKAHNLGPRMVKVKAADGKDVEIANWLLSLVPMPD